MITPPLSVPLDDQTRSRLEAAAAAAGLPVEAYAHDILQSALSPGVREGAAIFEGGPTRALNVTLSEAMADRLSEAAEDSGLDLDRYVGELIIDTFEPRDPMDLRTSRARVFQNAAAGAALADYDRTGVSVSLAEAFASVDRALAALPNDR